MQTARTEAIDDTNRPAAERIRGRQAELVASYLDEPADAWVVDTARTAATGPEAADPMHTRVDMGHGIVVPLAVHHAVGGDHELPVPGNVLSAALASCCDSTTRIIATHLGVRIEKLSVTVDAEVDVRGTLCVDRETPVAFQRMRIEIAIEAAPGTDPKLVRRLIKSAEHCCVVLQTLRNGVPVELDYAIATGDDA